MILILNFELKSEKSCIHSKCRKKRITFNYKLA